MNARPNPLFTFRRWSKPMTLLIGIKCKDAVVMASDSQLTSYSSKRTDSPKLETVSFSDFPVMVAQSGDLVLSNRFVDILSKMAEGRSVESPDEIGGLAQLAMRTLRSEQRELHFGVSSEELDEIYRKRGTQVGIMLGFFLKNAPHLITINLSEATYRKSRFHFEAEGCGASLAEYLLAEYTTAEMDVRTASIVALYVVEVVKRYDAMCGGPTKISVLEESDGLHSVGTYDQESVNTCACLIMSLEDEFKTDRIGWLTMRLKDDELVLKKNLFLEFK